MAALFSALAPGVSAQQPLSLVEADQRGQFIYQQSAVTGMVLVVVRGNESMIKTYGETAPASNRNPDAHSEVRLCSVSKILTTDLLARLVANGTVKLDDPLQLYAPRRKGVPTFALAQPIRLRNLATHTAGLPREVSSYPRNTPHFTFPDYQFRWTWLQTQKPKTAPGTAALYSNIGFDLLGDALASSTHQSYAQLLHDSLLQPLNMWDTTLVPSADQCARLLVGSRDEGPCTDTQPSGPSGGVYSTPADMLKLLQYLLHVPGSPTQPAGALDIYLKPDQLKSVEGLNHAGDATGIGLGWIQLGDPATPPQSSRRPAAAPASAPTSPSFPSARPASLSPSPKATATPKSTSTPKSTTSSPPSPTSHPSRPASTNPTPSNTTPKPIAPIKPPQPYDRPADSLTS